MGEIQDQVALAARRAMCSATDEEIRAADVQNSLREKCLALCKLRGWSLDWPTRSAVLHLEASELTEAIRGKRGDPLDESADVLFTLLVFSPYELDAIIKAMEAKIERLSKTNEILR
jgi:hypothetical protein